MLEKDKSYIRDVHMMDKHPHLQPKMRAILLDWLMEVCQTKIQLNLMPHTKLFGIWSLSAQNIH
jgi:hypothetical protein